MSCVKLTYSNPNEEATRITVEQRLERWHCSQEHCCSSRSPMFNSQHPHCRSQLSVTTVSGGPTPSSGLHKHQAIMVHIYVYVWSSQYIYILNSYIFDYSINYTKNFNFSNALILKIAFLSFTRPTWQKVLCGVSEPTGSLSVSKCAQSDSLQPPVTVSVTSMQLVWRDRGVCLKYIACFRVVPWKEGGGETL